MLRLLILVIFLFASVSDAAGFAGVGASARLLKTDDGNYEVKMPVMLYGGIKDGDWGYAVEGLYFNDKSASGSSLKMRYDHYEITGYGMYFLNYDDSRAINPYVVGGLGAYQERLEADFLGTKDKDTSKIYLVGKLGAGAWAQLGEIFFLNLEIKSMYSQHFSPDLQLEVSSRIGVQF